jgi:hypothetical protein
MAFIVSGIFPNTSKFRDLLAVLGSVVLKGQDIEFSSCFT